jgi:hypothetical protein
MMFVSCIVFLSALEKRSTLCVDASRIFKIKDIIAGEEVDDYPNACCFQRVMFRQPEHMGFEATKMPIGKMAARLKKCFMPGSPKPARHQLVIHGHKGGGWGSP